MQSKKLLLIAMFVLANVLGLTSLAHAGTVRMEFDEEIDQDGGPPAGIPPWIIATFQDNGPDTVLLTIEASMQAQDQSIKRIWFNTKDGIDANNLTIIQREGGPTVLSKDAVQDGFGAIDGMGRTIRGFDLQLKWSEFAFAGNDIVQFDISGSGLTADSFATKNNLGDFHFFAAGKIGMVEDENGGPKEDELIAPSSIPLPGSLLLGVIGMLAMPILISRWGRLTA